MRSLDELLESAAVAHGSLCAGQVIGVRMAILGCRLIGLNNPTSDGQRKKLIVFVEIDRCAADAIAHVTGAKLGKRSLKFRDYGIMAATFLNLENGEAFRVISTEEARSLVPVYAPEVEGKTQMIEAYKRMPENVLFRVQHVKVRIDDFELPGPPRYKAACSICGQILRDHREVVVDGVILCRPCAFGTYFEEIREINSIDIGMSPNRDDVCATTDS